MPGFVSSVKDARTSLLPGHATAGKKRANRQATGQERRSRPQRSTILHKQCTTRHFLSPSPPSKQSATDSCTPCKLAPPLRRSCTLTVPNCSNSSFSCSSVAESGSCPMCTDLTCSMAAAARSLRRGSAHVTVSSRPLSCVHVTHRHDAVQVLIPARST